MDLHKAFADHWDKQNPSAHVQACNDSRKRFEEYHLKREKERKQVEMDKIALEKLNDDHKLLFKEVGKP